MMGTEQKRVPKTYTVGADVAELVARLVGAMEQNAGWRPSNSQAIRYAVELALEKQGAGANENTGSG